MRGFAMNSLLVIFISGFVSLWFNVLYAQTSTDYLSTDTLATQFKIDYWTTEDGLPANDLTGIIQSSKGYLWMTSYQGIIRFDGSAFIVHNTDNTPVFSDNTFTSIAEEKDSTLKIDTEYEVYLYKDGLFSKSKKPHEILASDALHHVYYYEDHSLHFPDFDTSFTNIEINSIVEDGSNNLYIGTSSGLFQVSDKGLKHFTSQNGMENDLVMTLLVDEHNILWIGTQSGLYYYDGYGFQQDTDFNEIYIRHIANDNVGNFWLATTNGLYKKNIPTGEIEQFTVENGLPVNHIKKILIDFENNIWLLPFHGGLVRLTKVKFAVYDYKTGMKARVVNAVCEYNPNEILVVFEDGIIQKIANDKVDELRIKSSLKGVRLRHIFNDSKNNLWLSTYKGLLKISPSGEEKWFRTENAYPSSLIRLVYEDKHNNIWVGTRDVGLIKMQGEVVSRIIDHTSGLGENLIMSIEEDNVGNLIVATANGGVSILHNDEVMKVFSSETGLISDVVFNTYTDSANVMWFATSLGLSRIYKDSITNYNVISGLSSNKTYDIIEDNTGSFWLPYPLGVMMVSKNMLNDFAAGKIDKIKCTVFDKFDGVPSEGITPVAQSIKTNNGNIWIPALNGIIMVNPDEIVYNTKPPLTHIEALYTDDVSIDIRNQIRIGSEIQRITFNYTAICLQASEKVRFKYRLVGYENSWTETHYNNKLATYTNLPPGYYTFKVLAANNDGIWDETGDSLSIYVEPIWYETTIFKIAAVLFVLLLAYLFFMIRVGQLEKRQIVLKRIVEERTEEIAKQNQQLAELNAAKDKFFGIIAHDLRTPFNAILGFSELLMTKLHGLTISEIEQMVTNVHKAAKNTFSLLENLLEWAKSQTGRIKFEPHLFNLAEMIYDVVSLSENMAKVKNIRITHNISSSFMVYADKNIVSTVLRNLISNAIKFTNRNGNISIEEEQFPDATVITVCDSGIGIDEASLQNLFKLSDKVSVPGTENEKGTGLGLILCKEFIEMHKGKIWVESELGKGSSFKFSLPTRQSI
ncbi:MAG: hypothetical protein GY790_11900 [Bacteroidetes bacterium]|nr:hypothetical protein [Bacteroidota bacterium]